MIPNKIFFVVFLINVDVSTIVELLNDNAGAAQSIVAASSLLISVLIYVVYRKQNKISAAQHKSAVDVTKFRTHEQRDSIELQLSNYGQGAAKNIRGIVIPRIKEHNDDITNPTIINPTKTSVNLDRTDVIEDDEWNLVSGSTLSPGEKNQRYVLQLALNVEGLNKVINMEVPFLNRIIQWLYFEALGNQRERIPVFEDAVSMLASSGVDRLELEVKLRHKDALGRSQQDEVLHYMVPIVDGIGLQEAIDNGCEMSDYSKNKDEFEEDLSRLKLTHDVESSST